MSRGVDPRLNSHPITEYSRRPRQWWLTATAQAQQSPVNSRISGAWPQYLTAAEFMLVLWLTLGPSPSNESGTCNAAVGYRPGESGSLGS